jgi:hypothetical protein
LSQHLELFVEVVARELLGESEAREFEEPVVVVVVVGQSGR